MTAPPYPFRPIADQVADLERFREALLPIVSSPIDVKVGEDFPVVVVADRYEVVTPTETFDVWTQTPRPALLGATFDEAVDWLKSRLS